MDGAGAGDSYRAVCARASLRAEQVQTCRRVVAVAWKASGVGPAGASASADLGGSSKYSSEILED